MAHQRVSFIIAFALSFAIYTSTLAPTIYNLDSAELTTAAATLGFTRSTGYPLYILLGHIWSKIPIGDVGYRLNLFSAFCGALTVGILVNILQRLQVKGWAIFASIGIFITGKFFWALSSIAEVYTLQTALMSGLILCLLIWQQKPTMRALAMIGVMVGLCLCNHASSVLMLPGVIFFLLSNSTKITRKNRALVVGSVGLIIGLLPYLYLPLRYPALPDFNYAGLYDGYGRFHPLALDQITGIWTLVSGKSFSSLMFAYSFNELVQQVMFFLKNLWVTFLVVGIGPGLMGIYILWKRNWQAGIALLLMFLCHAIFFMDYKVVDKELMFLPTYLIWAVWLGAGFQWLDELLNKASVQTVNDKQFNLSSIPIWTFRGTITILVVFSFIIKYPLVDQSDNWSTRQLGEQMLDQLKPNALVFGYWEVIPVIEYLTKVEGFRPDVQAVNRFLISEDDLRAWILRDLPNRPIYIDSLPIDFQDRIKVLGENGLYQLVEIIP